jgi:hypothetical protein
VTTATFEPLPFEGELEAAELFGLLLEAAALFGLLREAEDLPLADPLRLLLLEAR